MGDPLHDQRSPREWAERQQVVEISEKIGCFPRLVEVVGDDLSALESGKIPADWDNSVVTGHLQFGFVDGADGLVSLQISLKAMVPAVCQRCLQAFDLPLSTTLAVLLRGPHDGPVEMQDFETWDLEEDSVSPVDIVDEALLMAMPLSAMHEEAGDCVAVATDDIGEEMTTPFASLRAQMDKGT